MSGLKRTTIETRLKLPEDLATRLHSMAREREMTLNQLLSELVQVGVISLEKDPPTLETGGRTGEGYVLSYPMRK